jgi:hypothetical protein
MTPVAAGINNKLDKEKKMTNQEFNLLSDAIMRILLIGTKADDFPCLTDAELSVAAFEEETGGDTDVCLIDILAAVERARDKSRLILDAISSKN